MVKLDRIFQELLDIRHRLDDIERMFSNWDPQPLNISESKLLSLPDNLRKTYLIVASEGECSATHVSGLTGRSRAIESSYLNQLVRMGWLTRRRNSKTLHFRTLSGSKKRQKLIQAGLSLQTPTELSLRP
jgi:DNA-binding MarR family transcriptional regulator